MINEVVLQYSYKIVSLPVWFVLVFESNNMPYTAEQQLLISDLFCVFVKLALCRASNPCACYLQIDN